MRLTDERILERLRAGQQVTLKRKDGCMMVSFMADDYVDIMRSIGDLSIKDWEIVEEVSNG